MFLFFLDNSYIDISGLQLNCLGGFLIKEDEYFRLQKQFEALKKEFGLEPFSAVKWSPDKFDHRFVAQHALASGNDFRKRVLGLISGASLKILCAFINNNLPLYKKLKDQRSINKVQFKRAIANYETKALEYLAQRFQMELKSISVRNGASVNGHIVIEAPASGIGPKMSEGYKTVWHQGSFTGSATPMRFDLLTDFISYTHDFSSDGIQLADFIVGSMAHALKRSQYDFVNIYKEKICRKSGKIKGVGIVVYPSNSNTVDKLIRALEA